MSERATRQDFRTWLTGQGLTYTAYSKLTIPVKAELYKKFQNRKKPA